jgi:hypothetical protein
LWRRTEIAAMLLEKGADKDAKHRVDHCRQHPCLRMWMMRLP